MYVNDKEILGEWADRGYFLKEYDDHTVTVNYKDNGSKELAAFNQTDRETTPEKLQLVCKKHHDRIATPVGATQ